MTVRNPGWLPDRARNGHGRAGKRLQPVPAAVRLSSVRRSWRAALGLSAVLIAVVGCGTARSAGRQETVHVTGGEATLTKTIVIDPHVGETFTPATPGAAPALTAQQAWAAYTRVDTSYSNSAIPPNVIAHLGFLTLPVGSVGPGGSEAYTAHNELVYGYSWHNCPASRNPKVPKLPPNPCIEWNFLNANTGQQVDETWQM